MVRRMGCTLYCLGLVSLDDTSMKYALSGAFSENRMNACCTGTIMHALAHLLRQPERYSHENTHNTGIYKDCILVATARMAADKNVSAVEHSREPHACNTTET